MDEGIIPIRKTVDNSNKSEEVTKLEAIIGWFDSMRVLDGFDNLKSAYRSFGFQTSPEALIKCMHPANYIYEFGNSFL